MILHIAEVAGLIFLAFVLGSALGFGARRLLARPAKPALVPAARLAAARGEAMAAAAAPTVAPVSVPVMKPVVAAAPVAPVRAVPTPPVTITSASPVVAQGPIPSAGLAVAQPRPMVPPVPVPPVAAPVAAVVPSVSTAPAATTAPSAADDDIMTPARPAGPTTRADESDDFAVLRLRSSNAAPVPAQPATKAGIAWSGDLNGHGARRPVRVAASAPMPMPPAPSVAAPQADPEANPANAPSAEAARTVDADLPAAEAGAVAPEPPAPAPVAVPPPTPTPPSPADVLVAPAPQADARVAVEAAPATVAQPVAAAEPVAPSPTLATPASLQSTPQPEAPEAVRKLPKIDWAVPPAPGTAAPTDEDAPPALFSDFSLTEAATSATKPDGSAPAGGHDERSWPEPAPPHPHLQPGVRLEDITLPSPDVEASELEIAETNSTPVATGDRDGEDDAMRAIEGGWSRRRSGGADRPELIDVSSAVAAAQIAVHQVLAQTGEVSRDDVGKPQGLARPRGGTRDDLLLISGLSPLDESTLSNLGVYHFDQIAGWSQAEVLWLENHVFARGRIGREAWQAQARNLVSRRPAPPRFARS